jgi:membrane associated rhomboid family serine protease
MIIPLTKKISWRNPPYVTIASILVNVFILFVIQAGDKRNEIQAYDFYIDSGLYQIEFPLYIDFLKHHRPETYKAFEQVDYENDPAGRIRLYRSLIFDKAFLDRLADGELEPTDILQRNEHQALREAYQQRLDKVVSLKYGFRPAQPRMVTWVTTMFLHGGVGHLLGNMLFLWLTGCLIEYGCRRWLFAVIYLLGGFFATGLFWLLNADSLIPLIGASGAISGIMGAFAVFYGFKRVRFFLNLGFYFNNLTFPAIAVLPFWIGDQLFQMVTNEGSGVAYAAHLGGLVGGAALAFVLNRIPRLLDQEGFEGIADDPVKPMIEKALGHMGRLEFSQARELLSSAEALQPANAAILGHLFTIDRQNPDTKEFHSTSQKLLDCLCHRPGSHEKAYQIYRQYVEAARPAKLGAAIYLLLARTFCDIGKLDDAKRLAGVLAKKRPDLNEVPSLLLKLARAYDSKGNRQSRNACLSCVCKQFPQSSEARFAKQQLALESKN